MLNANLLKQNFWALTHFQQILYVLFIRPFQKKDVRIFFDAVLSLPGQMYKAERKALYATVREVKPDYCFEIGTYTGGGSTFFISKALMDNDAGRLFTIENSERLYNKAINFYERSLKTQYPFIKFILSSSPTVFEQYLKENRSNMIFLDGAEDGKQTLEQYNFFKPYFKKGTILALHDWNTEKTIKVKPVITRNNHWIKLTELQQPESIGFAIFKYE